MATAVRPKPGHWQSKRMRCGFCQPASEHDSSLRNERRSFHNDEPHHTTNWKSLPTGVAPGGIGPLDNLLGVSRKVQVSGTSKRRHTMGLIPSSHTLTCTMTDASATAGVGSGSAAPLGCFDGRGTSRPYRARPYAVAGTTHFLMVPCWDIWPPATWPSCTP